MGPSWSARDCGSLFIIAKLICIKHVLLSSFKNCGIKISRLTQKAATSAYLLYHYFSIGEAKFPYNALFFFHLGCGGEAHSKMPWSQLTKT